RLHHALAPDRGGQFLECLGIHPGARLVAAAAELSDGELGDRHLCRRGRRRRGRARRRALDERVEAAAESGFFRCHQLLLNISPARARYAWLPMQAVSYSITALP